jgi:hypothetical protein
LTNYGPTIDQLLTKVSISPLLFSFDRVKIGAFYNDPSGSVNMPVQSTSTPRATRTTARTPQPKTRPVPAVLIDQDLRRSMIAQAAYYRAERRGFEPGHEAEDWVAAESEVDAALMLGALPLKS